MIKKIPVCPFCEKEMAAVKGEQALIPTKLSTQYVETEDHCRHLDVKVDDGTLAYGLDKYNTYRLWRCEGCGFVALWALGLP